MSIPTSAEALVLAEPFTLSVVPAVLQEVTIVETAAVMSTALKEVAGTVGFDPAAAVQYSLTAVQLVTEAWHAVVMCICML